MASESIPMGDPVCKYCQKPIKQLYPDTAPDLQWSHTTRADAELCPSRSIRTRTGGWPVPAELTGRNVNGSERIEA